MTVNAVKRAVLQLRYAVLVGLLAGQANGAHVSFEGGSLPSDVLGWTNVSVAVSADHAKFGTNSLKVAWTGAAGTKYVQFGPGSSTSTAGGSFWLYSKTNYPGATVRVQLLDASNAQVGYFDLNLEFSGWRGVFWKDEMFSTVPDGVSFNSLRLVFPDDAVANTVYIDGLFYVNTSLDGSQDYMVWQDLNFDGPGETASDTHWNLYPDFKNYPVPTNEALYTRAVTQAELDDLHALQADYDLVSTAPLSASAYNSAVSTYNTWKVSTNADGTVKGTPLFYKNMGYGTDAPDNFQSYQTAFLNLVKAYVQAEAMGPTNYAADLKGKALQMACHGREQGFSYGSANGSMSHYGYEARDWCLGLFLLRHALADAGVINQVTDDMGWLYVRNRIFNPAEGGSGDDIGTTMTGRFLSILIMPDEDAAVRTLRYFSNKLTKFLTPADAPVKPDNSWWHHTMMLPTYQPTHLGAGVPIVKNLQNTESFRISEEAHQAFKEACLHFIWYGDGAIPVSMQGRSPGKTSGTTTAKTLAENMALAGTPDGSGQIDREMAEQYARLNGGNPGAFASDGISAQPLEGNRTMPYGAWAGHRRDGWLVSIKGHSRYQPFGESLGVGKWRYMSHGTLEVMNSLSSSSYGIGSGWDWTRYPGTTILRRGTESIVSNVTQITYSSMEFPSWGSWAVGRRRFIGGLSHRDWNGCFVMQVEGAPGSNFYTMTADTDMVAKKGYFFFDDRVICLGSSITSQNSSYPMETVLIQNEWNSGEQILLDGSAVSFPSNTTDKSTLTTLLDQHNVGYYVANGQKFNLALRRQKPQDGAERDMLQAWINHGTQPANASYEYAVLPETTAGALAQFRSAMQTPGSEPYVVRKNTGDAQIVWDREIDTTAYIIYPSADSYSSYNESVTYTPFGFQDRLLDIDKAALIMIQPLSTQTLVMSVSDPNLGINASDHSAIDSPVDTKTLVLRGGWKFRETPASTVRIISQTTSNTTLEVDCQHGASQSFVLVDALGNNPPYRVENPPEYEMEGGTTAQFDLTQQIKDSESGVTFELLSGPGWVSLSSGGLMTVVAPVQINSTTCTNTVRVTDAGGLTLDVAIVVDILQDPVLIISPNAQTILLASGESTSVEFDVLYGGGGTISYGLSNSAPWLTAKTAIVVNGDFEQPVSNGWTFTDILTAGDHATQGYVATGSWTPIPAVSNAYYNLGRSSQLRQLLPVTMSSGTTYRVGVSMRQLSSSYPIAKVAFTDGSGTDLVFSAGNSYAASLGSSNGASFNMNNTSGSNYVASFTAGAAEEGRTLGLRIASVRDSSTALLGIDDVWLTANLPAGKSFTHHADISAAGLTNGTYTATVTVYDLAGVVASTNITVTLIVTDDRDGDGIPDSWERTYGGGSSTGLVASADGDQDGLSNLEEYILGYNPGVSNAPLLVSFGEIGSSGKVLSFGATTNTRRYTLEFIDNLVTGRWTNIASAVSGSNGVTTLAVPMDHNSGAYRVKVSVPE